MFSLNDEEMVAVALSLDSLSVVFADKPMSKERNQQYIKAFLRDAGLEHANQLHLAIEKTISMWTQPRFPWPADILDFMPRRHGLRQ